MSQHIRRQELRDSVQMRFEKLNPPAWADPHLEARPSGDEYSRVGNDRQFVVSKLRSEAWIEELTERGSASSHATDVPDRCVASVEVRSTRPDTLALFMSTTAQGGMRVAIEDPRLVVRWFPDCGCDACDWGSEATIAEVDDFMADVLQGHLHVVNGKTTFSVSGKNGSSRATGGLPGAPLGSWQGRAWLDT